MVDLIVQYLSFNKQVSLKGIGTFTVEQLPARLDFPNRLLHAPQAVLHFSSTAKQDDTFEQWICDELHINSETALQKQQIFLTDFQRTLNSEQIVEWAGLGKFEKKEKSLLHFTAAFESIIGEPVKAEKIIRKNKEHFVRVGEEEKTSTEMEELLFGARRKKLNLFWIFAMALFLIGFVLVWMFAAGHSRQWGTQGNGHKLKSKEMPVLYKIQ